MSAQSEEPNQDEAHRLRMLALKQAQDAEARKRTEQKGLLLVNTGDGKGKSTAGFGLALRAAGQGLRVAVFQFTKGSWKTGEGAAFARFPEIDHFIVGDGFTWNTQDRQADMASARRGFALVEEAIEACRGETPKYQLLVLDELNIVVDYEYLPVDLVVAALASRPRDLHVCVTGRGARPELIAIADTVTDMQMVKHAYAAGIKAQRGIEF
ncbi:MAG TPA: cob(I)yrinic acid a,c-diamide adenosyltransferase [Polyangiales bacterium]